MIKVQGPRSMGGTIQQDGELGCVGNPPVEVGTPSHDLPHPRWLARLGNPIGKSQILELGKSRQAKSFTVVDLLRSKYQQVRCFLYPLELGCHIWRGCNSKSQTDAIASKQRICTYVHMYIYIYIHQSVLQLL